MKRLLSKLSLIGVCGLLFGMASVPSRADDLAGFYSGKTVTVAIGYSAGGGYDLYARLLARYMGKYIPGNPTIVPQNMPGAGSLKVAKYLYEVAPKDGDRKSVV